MPYLDRRVAKATRARKAKALERTELRQSTTPRQSADGATSFAIKQVDPELAAMIKQHMEKKNAITT